MIESAAWAFDKRVGSGGVSRMYETSGRLKWIGTTQSFASGFTKREFVVTTTADKYPQDLKFEVVKERCSLLDGFELEQEVQVSFDIRGNEYNGRYYVNLSCWKIQAAGAGAPAGDGAPARGQEPRSSSAEPRRSQAPARFEAEPSAADLRNEDDFDDDIPF